MARKSRPAKPRQGGHAQNRARNLSLPTDLPGPLKKDVQEIEYRDEEATGLSLRLGLRGGAGPGVWSWRYKSPDGAWRRLSLGKYPAMSYADARSALEQAKVDKQTGIDPHAAKAEREAARAARVTFAQHVEERAVPYFLTKKRSRDPIYLLRRLAIPALGHKALEDIASADIEKLIESELERARRESKKGTIANALRAVLSTTFALAKRRYIVRNAEFGQSLPHGTPKELAFEQPDDAAQFMAGVDAAMPSEFARALKLILLTGARPIEIMTLRRSNYVADHLVPNVSGGKREFTRTPALKWSTTKNGRPHLIPLSRQAHAVVKELLSNAAPDADALLFASTKKPGVSVSPTRLANEMQIVRTNLNLPDNFSPHCLRKSTATLIEALGFGRHIADMALNHVAKDVTGRHYSMFKYMPEIIEALQLLADMVAPDGDTKVLTAEVIPMIPKSNVN